MADDNYPQFTSLFRLPNEVFDAIVVFLSPRTLKNLRLAINGKYDQLLLRRLFHCIALSKLKSDRQVFLNIALEPKLACHVRRITWHDLPGDKLDVNGPAWLRSWPCPMFEHRSYRPYKSEEYLLRRQEIDALSENCWLVTNLVATEKTQDQIVERCMTQLKEFLPTFRSAIHNMPNLCAIRFQVMVPDPWRVLKHDDLQHSHYPFLERRLRNPESMANPASNVYELAGLLSEEVETARASRCAKGEIIYKIEHRRPANCVDNDSRYTGGNPRDAQWLSMHSKAEAKLFASFQTMTTTYQNLHLLILVRAVLSPAGLRTFIRDHAPRLDWLESIDGHFTTSHVASLTEIKDLYFKEIEISGSQRQMLVPSSHLKAYLNRDTPHTDVNVLDRLMEDPETATSLPIITSDEIADKEDFVYNMVNIDYYIAKS